MGVQSSPGRVLANLVPRDRIGQCYSVGRDARWILPCGQGRIDSVKINPSLLMMREFTFPCPDPALEASIRWCYTVAMCYSRVTRCYILRTTQNRQQNLLGILDSHLPLIQLGDWFSVHHSYARHISTAPKLVPMGTKIVFWSPFFSMSPFSPFQA